MSHQTVSRETPYQAEEPPHRAHPSPLDMAPGAHIADPAALGLAGFAMTTFVLSVVNAKLIPATVLGVVFGLALFYGGLAQLLAGMWEFAKGNTFGALAFSSYGGFWLSYWYLVTRTNLSGAGADATKGIGVYLLGWAIFTAYMTLAALRVSGVVTGVFVALTATYVLLAIGAFSGTAAWDRAGGWVGIVTAAIAWYGSFASVFNYTYKRPVMPVWPR